MNRAGIRLRLLLLSLLLMPLPCLALPAQEDAPPDLHLNDPKPTTILVRVVAHGSPEWEVLMLHCRHLVSSHIDVPVHRPPQILRLLGTTVPPWRTYAASSSPTASLMIAGCG